MLNVIMFWDYDTQWGADRSRLPGGAKDWGMLEFTNTEILLDLHSEYEVPACFAVVGAASLPGERPYHDPSQIRKISEMGHEIASHMNKHEWIPGIGYKGLKESLITSKNALENCIGQSVVSFVPPYNQPFDFPQKFSFSFSERRRVTQERIDIPILCELLNESGYKFSRISYMNVLKKIGNIISGKDNIEEPTQIEKIGNISCLKLNTPGGFQNLKAIVNQQLNKDGFIIAYGHPHSILSNNSQNINYLKEFLYDLQILKNQGKIKIMLPNQLIL